MFDIELARAPSRLHPVTVMGRRSPSTSVTCTYVQKVQHKSPSHLACKALYPSSILVAASNKLPGRSPTRNAWPLYALACWRDVGAGSLGMQVHYPGLRRTLCLGDDASQVVRDSVVALRGGVLVDERRPGARVAHP